MSNNNPFSKPFNDKVWNYFEKFSDKHKKKSRENAYKTIQLGFYQESGNKMWCTTTLSQTIFVYWNHKSKEHRN